MDRCELKHAAERKITIWEKELKKLAKEIVTLEQIIDTNEDEKAVNKAKNRIIEISGHLDPEDMMRIDELVQEQMQNQS